MGTVGIEIAGGQEVVNQTIEKLNSSFADEWLAYYQYWLGAKLARGLMRGDIVAELTQHADEELGHANSLADRIIQLGGTPLLSPDKWLEKTKTGFAAPTNCSAKVILQQNIEGEQKAIKLYQDFKTFSQQNGDEVTYQLIADILADEVEHEEDLEAIMQDLTTPAEGVVTLEHASAIKSSMFLI